MSSRSWSAEALILSVSQFTEDHRSVSVLLPQDQGCTIIPATLFGGARSKLRGMVVPYQSGRIWLYSNPIKNSHKITDFSVNAYRMELRESLMRSWCAAVCSEITIKTCGTVEWRLVNAFLDGLCISDDEGCERGLLRFLWRLLQTAGVAPDISQCGSCGIGLKNPESPETAVPASDASSRIYAAVYSPSEDSCFCSGCRRFDPYLFPLSTEALGYLHAVTEKAPGYSRHLPLSSAAYGELKRLLFFLTEKMIGAPLKTFQIGAL